MSDLLPSRIKMPSTLAGPSVGSAPVWYSQNPLEILAIPKDRLGIYGALAGCGLCPWLYTWRNDLEVWEWLGLAAPGLALAQAIWRWGDCVNQRQNRTPALRAISSQPKAKAKA